MKFLAVTLAALTATCALVFATPVAADPTDDGVDVATPTVVKFHSLDYALDDAGYSLGFLTGTPVGGGPQVTGLRPAAFGRATYLKSVGFGDTPPESVSQWDAAVDRMTVESTDTSTVVPYIGIGRARELMALAVQLPPDTVLVSYLPYAVPGEFEVVWMQPVAP